MPRIRTIKPDFWSHPIMAKQDDATRLMAIALLNYADDEGYFHAEPNLVRGFCRPFDDDSTITRRCLDKLSKIGYISMCKNDDYGMIGFIEKFSEHQKIDRPNNSKLKTYYSTTFRRSFDDDSLQEGKGMEGKGKEIETITFITFWDSYHSITGLPKSDKVPAEKYWNKLKNDEREKAVDMINPYFNSLNDKKYCKKARTYLADKNFNDENLNRVINEPIRKGPTSFPKENPNFVPDR